MRKIQARCGVVRHLPALPLRLLPRRLVRSLLCCGAFVGWFAAAPKVALGAALVQDCGAKVTTGAGTTLVFNPCTVAAGDALVVQCETTDIGGSTVGPNAVSSSPSGTWAGPRNFTPNVFSITSEADTVLITGGATTVTVGFASAEPDPSLSDRICDLAEFSGILDLASLVSSTGGATSAVLSTGSVASAADPVLAIGTAALDQVTAPLTGPTGTTALPTPPGRNQASSHLTALRPARLTRPLGLPQRRIPGVRKSW